MATKHTCTITVRCRKQHTCVGCGGQFSYLFARKVVGTAGTPEAATAAAEASAVKRLENDVDYHPCPTCGLYQPDMIGSRRASAQRILWMASIAVSIVMLILSVSHLLQDDVAVPTALGIFAVIGVIQLAIDARRPNRDLQANQQVAQGLVDRGVLQVDAPGRAVQAFDEAWKPQSSLLGLVALLFFLAGLAGVAAPTLVRELQGWPFNPGCYPGVVGPGDSTCFYMPQSVHSIKGYFRANPEATAHIGESPDEIRLSAESNQSTWGDEIQVKSDEKDNSKRLWVTLEFPDREELANQKLDCHVKLDVEYPKVDGERSFRVEQQTFEDQVPVKLGSRNCGSTYHSIWWWGTVGGMGLLILSGGLRQRHAAALQKQANRTSVFTLGDAPQ